MEKSFGSSGKSGCMIHADWGGYGYDIECDENYPNFLKDIITFRNISYRKEWMNALEHNAYGDNAEERYNRELFFNICENFPLIGLMKNKDKKNN